MKFMHNYELKITPLSPIHLGTGEDFLPTNYVIDGGLLYEFDPAKAVLKEEEKRQLKVICNGSDFKKVYDFLKNHKNEYRACAYHKVGISSLSSGKEVARCATNPVTNLPVILGSALKGCVRTALLHDLVKENKFPNNEAMQSKYLGSIKNKDENHKPKPNDLFIQFKPSDLEAVNKSIRSYICKVNKHYKKTGLV